MRVSYDRVAQNSIFVNNNYRVVLVSNVVRGDFTPRPTLAAQGWGTRKGFGAEVSQQVVVGRSNARTEGQWLGLRSSLPIWMSHPPNLRLASPEARPARPTRRAQIGIKSAASLAGTHRSLNTRAPSGEPAAASSIMRCKFFFNTR